MGALIKLWFYKQRAVVRNLFRKASSAILTVLMVLLYGYLIVMFLTMDTSAFSGISAEMAILLGIGMGALLSLTQLMQKRKALFMEEDSYYLFSGPFSRKQVMRYLMGQTLINSILYSLLSVFIMICFGAGSGFSVGFLGLCLIGFMLLFVFFFVFTDYLYVLSITDTKYKAYARIIAIGFIAIVALIFMYTAYENDFQMNSSLTAFTQSSLFNFVPLFGWVKLFLISAFNGETMLAFLGFAIMVLANVVVYCLFTAFKGDFYEQAMMDSVEFSSYVKQIKAGKQSAFNANRKVKKASISFQSGAAAIFSKNYLIMKKTGTLLSVSEVGILIFYFIISLLTDLGFGMFCYMMVLYIFQLLQSSDLVQELKNYQIYLIPDKPFSKLIYAILPTLLKITFLCSVAVIGSGLYYRMGFGEILNYVIMLIGYALVFVSATVLSIRLLKSRTNMLAENLLRMLVILVCSLPSVFLIGILIFQMEIYDMNTLNMTSYVSLALNIVISILILYMCKDMMKGREISSD